MLDLNFVRENLDTVRAALEARRHPTAPLKDFARLDSERKRVISESDKLNAERNSASREIGALMKSGRKDEAESQRKAAPHLLTRREGPA